MGERDIGVFARQAVWWCRSARRSGVYLSKSVQSVQSYRKCYKSRINIGVSSEPISNNNRCSTGAIGSASAAEPPTAQFFRLRGSSQWFTSERSGQQLGAVFQSQPDGAWKKSGRDRGLDSGDSLSVPSVEHAVSAQSYSYAYGVRLTVAISSSRIRTLAKARYSVFFHLHSLRLADFVRSLAFGRPFDVMLSVPDT